MVDHANLTAAALHEPKGIDSASASQLYVSDGAGSGTWTDTAVVVGGLQKFVGEVFLFSGNTAPTGSVFCHGQALSRSQFSALNAIYNADSYPYGDGDGSTTFNVPDLRDRVAAGKDADSGGFANRLTAPAEAVSGLAGTNNGVDGNTLGNNGGSQTHIQTLTQLKPHYHDIGPTTANQVGAPQSTGATINLNRTSREPLGTSTPSNPRLELQTPQDGNAFNIVQPTLILNYCVYTGVA